MERRFGKIKILLLTLWHLVNVASFLYRCVDLCPDKCGMYHTHKDHQGNIDVEFSFAENLPEPVYLFAYVVYDSGIRVDSDLNVKKGL